MSPARRLLILVGAVALLDLTTGLFASFIDVFGAVEPPPTWVRVLELALVIPLLASAPSAFRAIRPHLRSLPGSRVALALMLSYLLGSVVVVLFRTEAYPFSNVGMFSAVPQSVDATAPRTEPSVVFVRDSEIVAVAPLREGSSLSATWSTGWDYKTGWLMLMFGTTHSVALQHAADVARRNGFERAARALVHFDPRTGRTLGIEPYRRQ